VRRSCGDANRAELIVLGDLTSTFLIKDRPVTAAASETVPPFNLQVAAR